MLLPKNGFAKHGLHWTFSPALKWWASLPLAAASTNGAPAMSQGYDQYGQPTTLATRWTIAVDRLLATRAGSEQALAAVDEYFAATGGRRDTAPAAGQNGQPRAATTCRPGRTTCQMASGARGP